MHTAINLNSVLSTALGVASERVSTRGIRLESDLKPDLPQVMGERARLETVVLNLLNNAIDAVQDGPEGLIRVTSRQRQTPEGECVEVTVEDNGPGIPPEALDRIFDPFFTTKSSCHGHGLGLFLSYGIITEHRGRLEVRNGAGAGAVFTVLLPIIVDAPPAPAETPRWELQGRS